MLGLSLSLMRETELYRGNRLTTKAIKQDQKLDGVYVVGVATLVSLLKQLDRN